MGMLYRVYAPTPELADIVSGYWSAPVEPNTYSEQLYATPLFEGMVFNFTHLVETLEYAGQTACLDRTAYIFGQTKSWTRISGCNQDGGYIIGVRFKPLGLVKITGINMVHLADKAIDAEEIWGNELKWLCEAMQEAHNLESAIIILENFLKKQREKIHLHARLNHVCQALPLMKQHNGNISCETLQDLTNTTKKTLERAFLNYHGMQPKMYMRIIRFNFIRNVLERCIKTNLTELAHQLGYFDQSHFIREFKQFSGYTPTQYLKIIEEEHRKRTIPVD
jgi:AraC-like DNA-binding protein